VRDNFNKLLVPVFLLQLQDKVNKYGIVYGVNGDVTFSRNHETEADQIGLTLMAIAGYNPEEAIGFWTRMAANSGEAPPEFQYTPSDASRIASLKAMIPQAKATAAKI
jgi:predicted Zn-dependent protease